MAIAYLVKQKHKKIALIMPENTNSATMDRREGFVSALLESNIPIENSSWCLVSRKATLNGQALEVVYDFFKSHPEVTACFCVDYHLTKLAYETMERLGRKIGQDIEIICFDPPSYPNISYLSQDTKAIAQNAVRILLNQLENSPKIEKMVIPVQLHTNSHQRVTISFNENFYFRYIG
jgi:GntR family transcriptional regulator, arabinose operon transcriptional repressor